MSEPIHITASMAINALAEVIRETGDDYVYVNAWGDSPIWDEDEQACTAHAFCSYVHSLITGNIPGCIVGRALVKLGVPMSELLNRNALDAVPLFMGLREARIADVDCAAGQIFGRAQAVQDSGRTYGTAYADALKVHQRLA